MKCKLNKEKECEILNKQLGDCEIEELGEIQWRCPNYKDESQLKGEEE